ncbi:MAG: SRPBCC family protein, partial [Candidatus Omnitrophica bacterium]|nr:SRPBCC family protein [Candidatus Omnitrophota bacterium]
MQDSTLMYVSVSRVIPAYRWRVIRLLTKVWEFPSYIPTVKEVQVIHKTHNKIKTKWKIQVDNIPISWTEEEILALGENKIYFKALEGDLSEFKGEWKFQDCEDGTKVTVEVSLNVGIPIIKDFAESYIKKLITKNFESILMALERRLISLKYKQGNSDKIAGFGIIGHPYNLKHLETSFKMLNPDFKMPSLEFISRLFHISPSFKLYDIKKFKSKTGKEINGCFIIATFIPDMIEKDIWAIFSKVVKACKIAEKHGMGVVTLGGFTSIIAERIAYEISSEVDIAVTSGNTFTAAMVIDGVLKAASLLNLDISTSKITIIGGTGDIGSACGRVLAEKARELIITGRTKANLNRLKAELSRKRKARIIATTNNKQAVKNADIVIAAASATSAILNVDWFKPGAIICDVGYPKNISYAPVTRQDILIFSGGLAKSPTSLSLPIDLGLPAEDTTYGCFAEGIILALEKKYENYSSGRGNITPEKIEEIRELGNKHGFEVSDFYWGHRRIDDSIIEQIKK